MGAAIFGLLFVLLVLWLLFKGFQLARYSKSGQYQIDQRMIR
jgi:hypothetical protein